MDLRMLPNKEEEALPLIPMRNPLEHILLETENYSDSQVSTRFENTSLSYRTWSLDWQVHLPLQLNNNVRVESASFVTISNFAQKHFPQIYQTRPETQFQWFESSAAKTRYYEMTCDFFLFRAGTETVGMCVAQPTDWSTYYIRNISISPAYQGQGLYQTFLKKVVRVLETAPIERLELELSPQNTAHVHVLNKFGFVATSLALSERWGALTRFTKYLSPLHAKAFSHQFSLHQVEHPERTKNTQPQFTQSESTDSQTLIQKEKP